MAEPSDIVAGRGQPILVCSAKRTQAKRRLRIDWLNALRNTREPGLAYVAGYVWRPSRKLNKAGLQYRCTTGGVASGDPWESLKRVTGVGQTVADGSVIWTAEPIDANSLRAAITGNGTWSADTGVTLSDQSNADLIFIAHVSGGTSGNAYEIRHKVTLTNTAAEVFEGLFVLPVAD